MADVFPTLMIVPTGIGCEIGGYAGDALPAARLLAAASGCLVTHPNVMNGAALYWSDERIFYVEGWGLDRFAAGELALRGGRRQRIGLLLDAAIEPSLRDRHLQVADACRATLGLEIGPVVTTDVALGVTLRQGESASFRPRGPWRNGAAAAAARAACVQDRQPGGASCAGGSEAAK